MRVKISYIGGRVGRYLKNGVANLMIEYGIKRLWSFPTIWNSVHIPSVNSGDVSTVPPTLRRGGNATGRAIQMGGAFQTACWLWGCSCFQGISGGSGRWCLCSES